MRSPGASTPPERRPVLSLAPQVGDVDLVVASELLEAGHAVRRRLCHAGPHHDHHFNQPLLSGRGEDGDERGPLRSAAADRRGREKFARHAAARPRSDRARSRRHDQCRDARRDGRRVLPIPTEAFERAVRADGKAVDANLRGFRAGFDAAHAGSQLPGATPKRPHAPSPAFADLEREIATMPAVAQAVMIEGAPPRGLSGHRLMRGSISTGSSRCATLMRKPAPAGNCWRRSRANLRSACPTKT